MNLKEFSTVLKGVCGDTNHFGAEGSGFPRIIYAETGREYEYADNEIVRRTYKVGVHLFIKDPFDPIIDQLEDTFVENGVAFDLLDIEHGVDQDGKKGITAYHYDCEI